MTLTRENLAKEIDLKTPSIKEMCQVIFLSGHVKGKNGHPDPKSWEDIYNYSPTGELVMLYEWYLVALNILGHPEVAQFIMDKEWKRMEEVGRIVFDANN